MSRASTSSQRNLTLTEELEKLEQSITLTLQEIDHNFSRAHRVVTTSILPIVEQYAEQSKNVWEGSKFWKQFFEASANVSLSGYEEPTADETVTEVTAQTTPTSSAYASPSQTNDDDIVTPAPPAPYRPDDDNFSSPTNNTPRPPRARTTEQPPTIAPFASPYEALKREIQGSTDTSTLPSTPRQPLQFQSQTPQSSPFMPPSTAAQLRHRTPANDILLHRVLDKNYRLQATPHAQPSSRLPYPKSSTQTPGTTNKKYLDSTSPDSSPPVPAPELHAEIFDTPARKGRTPGISVLTPAAKNLKTKTEFRSATQRTPGADTIGNGKAKGIWDSDSDEDDDNGGYPEGMSPPKTMQFHIPQSKLLRTPAREASRRIVEDLLLTAGGNLTDDLDEDSPSMVKRGGLLEEDTF
ncbi:DASH complex subunit Ask1 [Lasallia pustulata]|uniref:DASH complex subunit ASK1 n=1 Tax=Lasallia pustulata TaxID=136370 RepID=A0A1W5CTV1_9LECA|nr:DASH complex subunit Ask1 [Lasallia pustulata]